MNTHSTVLAGLIAGAALLAGCDRPAPRADGDRVAAADSRNDTASQDLQQAGRQARDAAANAGEAVVDKTRDAAITAQVKSRLATDSNLSALAIDVDTAGGRVALKGSAPDSAARERAGELARGVNGVVSVDNELRVDARK